MPIADELQKLQQLYQTGAIDEQEFALAKAKLLREPGNNQSTGDAWYDGRGNALKEEQDTRTWAMLLHLSILAGFAVPFAGLVAPVIIWQLKKDELPEIDIHGRNAMNWIISKLIYATLCVILCFLIIGFPLLIALGVIAVVFPIVAAIKANNGEVWRYPMSIPFFT